MSMVRADLLYQIHERLQQIKQNQLPFGGVCVLLFGDLLQLRPVRGRFVFQQPRSQKYSDFFQFLSLWSPFTPIVLETNHR